MGKRGGIRVIYYWDAPDIIYMLFAYRKNEIKILSKLVQEYLK